MAGLEVAGAEDLEEALTAVRDVVVVALSSYDMAVVAVLALMAAAEVVAQCDCRAMEEVVPCYSENEVVAVVDVEGCVHRCVAVPSFAAEVAELQIDAAKVAAE